MRLCYLYRAGRFGTIRPNPKYLSDHGHDVHIITARKNGFSYFNMTMHSLGISSPLDYPMGALRLRKILKKIKPDVLHVWGVGTKAALVFLSGFKGPIVGTPAGSDIHRRREILPFYIRMIQRIFLKRADLLIINGSDLKNELIKLGVPEQKIITIPFGINLDEFKPDTGAIRLEEALCLNTSKVVMIVSGLVPVYGIENFIKAIPLILSHVPNTKFLIIGSGPIESRLKRLAIDMKIKDNTLFLGRIPQEDMCEYYNSADVFTLTCINCGGVSTALLEAMACELPVVVTDTGSYREFVEDGYNGFVTPIGDVEKFATMVIKLLNSEELREKFGKRGRKIVERKGTAEVNMKKMEREYQKLIQV